MKLLKAELVESNAAGREGASPGDAARLALLLDNGLPVNQNNNSKEWQLPINPNSHAHWSFKLF